MTLTHPITGLALAPVIDIKTAASIIGEHEHTVMARCRSGEIVTMNRPAEGGPWRIITAKFLRQLGLLDEVAVTADP